MEHSLRDLEVSPPHFEKGDYVLLWERDSLGKVKAMSLQGEIIDVGVSQYNIAYDWYIVRLDDGGIIESWWMTQYEIRMKLSPRYKSQNG